MVLLLRSIRSQKRRALVTDLASIARKELENTLDSQVKPALIKSHELVVSDWKNKPDFKAKKYITPEMIKVTVYPSGDAKAVEIYEYVDQGTKPHIITPIHAPNLIFRTGYQPKTLAKPARTVPSGGHATGDWVATKLVHHPGSEAREFSKTIAGDIEPSFKNAIENTFRDISRKLQE